MPPNNPLCTVIVPAFNAAGTILRAVQSVLDQTEQDLELRIVDDGSTDDTTRAVASMVDDPRIFVTTSPKNTGAAGARNLALHQARGRYIAFLDADDFWFPNKLEQQLDLMQSRDAAFSYTSFIRRTRHRDFRVTVPPSVTHAQLLSGNVIGCLTAMYDTQKLGKVPMPNIAMRHDYALWLDILKMTPNAVGLNTPLAVHHRQRVSLSANPIKACRATYDMLRNHQGLSPIASACCIASHYHNRLRCFTPDLDRQTPSARCRCDKASKTAYR